jgi:hypothetical protein
MLDSCEFVVSGRDTPTLLDLVEEPFNQVACAIKIRAGTHDRPQLPGNAFWLAAIAEPHKRDEALRRMGTGISRLPRSQPNGRCRSVG